MESEIGLRTVAVDDWSSVYSKKGPEKVNRLGYEPSLGPSPYPPERKRSTQSEVSASEYSRGQLRGAQTVSQILNGTVVIEVVTKAIWANFVANSSPPSSTSCINVGTCLQMKQIHS